MGRNYLGRGLRKHLGPCGDHHRAYGKPISTYEGLENDRATCAHEVSRLWRGEAEASARRGVGVGGELEGSHFNQIRAPVNSQIAAINVPFIHLYYNVFGGSNLMHLTAEVLARPSGRWHNCGHVTIDPV